MGRTFVEGRSGLESAAQFHAEAMPQEVSIMQRLFEQRFPVNGPDLFVEVVSPKSPALQDIHLLQEERFARASAGGSQITYRETVDIDPQHTIPLAVRRHSGLLVGTALLELSGATNIEFMVRFRPGSPSAAILAASTFAEIRGFALRSGLEWGECLDVLDTLGSALVQIARQRDIQWLWTLPRKTAMSLMLAEIPDVLPPFRFTPSIDVLGWKEESPQLQKMRQLHLKALPLAPDTLPIIYQITPALLAEDLARRIALTEQRHHMPDIAQVLQAAMRRASRKVHTQLDLPMKQNNGKEDVVVMPMILKRSKTQPTTPTSGQDTSTNGAISMEPAQKILSKEAGEKGFLPGAAAESKAEYLRQFVEQGGAAATRYKTMNYDLLQLQPGMQVLDVGCGVGLDLLPLAERVGLEGLVIGVDHDSVLVQKAKEACVGHANVRAVVGEAEALPFAHRSFDGVRADRVLQHIPQPDVALAEMWRILRPGGILSLVEPDWKMVGLFPGSPTGGNDDHTWNTILAANQREITHPLIGRQLSNLLHQPGEHMWEGVQVQVEAFVLTSFASADAVLRLSEMAQRLTQQEPTMADEITAWLKEMKAAEQRGGFLASMQLFYVCARKPGSGR